MHIFLIRHGESVDNVAGLYAGSRDSALTAHGVLQTRRLGSHLSQSGVQVKHVFSSNLQRAVKTAKAVLDSQNVGDNGEAVQLLQLTELREKDFGSGEGQKFGVGKSGDRIPHEGAETPDAMRVRVDRFLDDHLFPILRSKDEPSESAACVVVAHGLILSTLFRALCARLLAGHLTLGPEVPRAGPDFRSDLPVLPSWSNTGYLHGVFSPSTSGTVETGRGERDMLNLELLVKEVNCTSHLKGLKKTRGGIGSARFDDKQKSIDSFFGAKAKKRKADEATS